MPSDELRAMQPSCSGIADLYVAVGQQSSVYVSMIRDPYVTCMHK